MSNLDPRLHFVVATAIVVKDGKYLILKRSENEIASPGRWTVPGGKLVRHEYEGLPMTPNTKAWYNIVDFVLKKEVREEANLEIKDLRYLTDLVFIRPDNFPVIVLSYWCKYKSGEVKLAKDMTDYAWITPEETKNYDLIEDIAGEIIEVDKILKGKLT